MLVIPSLADAFPATIGLFLILIVIVCVVVIIVARIKLFQKCNIEGWKAIIPFYSSYVFVVEVCGLHWAWFVGLLVVDLSIVTSAPTASALRIVINGFSFYNLALKCHKDPIPSMIFGAFFSGAVTCVYGFGKKYIYDKYVEVKNSAIF